MKTLGLLIALVFLSSYSFATFGSWTLYYTDNPYADANGNLWLGSPTVGITGNDGGSYCVAEDGCNGIEQAWVLLAGNVWESGPIYYAVNSPTVSASYTWPDIEITGPTDVSYAGKVEGAIQLSGHEGWTEPDWTAFYDDAFVEEEGTNPPSPCQLGSCVLPFGPPFSDPTRGWGQSDLDSEQVFARISTTYWGPPVVQTKDVCYWGSLACSVGTPTCTTGIGVVFVPVCPAYVEANYLVISGQCFGVHLLTQASGPGPCN
ncbi:MAG: hypothetical protein ACLPXM_17345 [Terriglobales bacterium]|jgi:hypothetical protein